MIKGKKELIDLFNMEQEHMEDVDEAIDHGILVANLAYRLAKELGYSQEFCEKMADAGILHDIGKMKISGYLYGRRKNVLKIEEIKYVRKHPALGYDFLTKENIVDEESRQMILHHHENVDGSGYPDNMKGDDIPIGSRILRISDVYSALVSERPYRAAFDKETAMELMIDEVKNFDMKFFLAFMRVVHADDFVEIDEYVENCNAKTHVKEIGIAN